MNQIFMISAFCCIILAPWKSGFPVVNAEDKEKQQDKRAYEKGYDLITAESQFSVRNVKTLCNLNGEIGLTYDMKVSRSSINGIHGIRWGGMATKPDDPFQISMVDVNAPKEFRGKRMAYDVSGKDPTVKLQDDGHQGTRWEMVTPKDEWFKKYNKTSPIPFHLRAVDGKFKGYYLTFDEPETVKLGEDRTYVRRKAILAKEPTELSVLLRLDFRER